jgi:hypothetical protein
VLRQQTVLGCLNGSEDFICVMCEHRDWNDCTRYEGERVPNVELDNETKIGEI